MNACTKGTSADEQGTTRALIWQADASHSAYNSTQAAAVVPWLPGQLPPAVYTGLYTQQIHK